MAADKKEWRRRKMDRADFLDQLRHIKDFQIGDLTKADAVGANFLVCVGCFNSTEFIGGVLSGQIGESGKVSMRLRKGIRYLGPLFQKHENALVQLRNSTVHSYLGQVTGRENVRIASPGELSRLGLSFMNLPVQIANGDFVVNVSSWIAVLDDAWERLIILLESDEPTLDRAMKAFDRLPKLV